MSEAELTPDRSKSKKHRVFLQGGQGISFWNKDTRRDAFLAVRREAERENVYKSELL